MPKRKSYTAGFKLQVIKFAKEKGNRAAGREFDVGETSAREWRKDEKELKKLNPRKRARQGGKPKWPHLEVLMMDMIPTGLQETRSSKFCRCQRQHFASGKVTSSLRACFIYLPIPTLLSWRNECLCLYKSR